MNTKQIKSSFVVRAAMLLLTALTTAGAWAQLTYIECSWDDTNKQVVKTTKTLSNLIGYDDTPGNGDYKEVTSVSGWFQLGGYTLADEYYVVRGNVSHTTINVLGKNVHLILCDGAKLTLSGGILMYGDHKLYIHSQSYGESMGKLDIESGYYDRAAGIGSDYVYGDESTSYQRTPGDLEIHGGDIYAKGGDRAAGIGGGNYQHGGLVIIYGGKIAAHGGDGIINICDVTDLVDILLNVGHDLNVVVTGAEGITFGGSGTGPAR